MNFFVRLCLLPLLLFSSKNFATDPSYTFYVISDALFWHASENGLALATKRESPSSLKSRVVNPEFAWDFGFKIGFGAIFTHRGWDLSLSYTSLHTDAHSHVKGPVLVPQWIHPLSFSSPSAYVDEADLHWRLHLGVIDLPIKKSLSISPSFTLSPYIGIRAASLRQKDNMSYRGGTLFPGGEDTIRMKDKFFGVGPLLGSHLQYFLYKKLSLIANGSISLAYGSIYLHQDEDATLGIEERMKIHSIFPAAKAFTDLLLGLNWQASYKKLSWDVSLCADELFCFGQNQLMRFVNPSSPGLFIANQGDISLSGYSLRMLWTF